MMQEILESYSECYLHTLKLVPLLQLFDAGTIVATACLRNDDAYMIPSLRRSM